MAWLSSWRSFWPLAAACAVPLLSAAEPQPKPPPPKPKTQADFIKQFDRNGDGKLDDAERAAMNRQRRAELLKKYDKNGDGKLDKAERNADREEFRKQRQEAKPKTPPPQKQP